MASDTAIIIVFLALASVIVCSSIFAALLVSSDAKSKNDTSTSSNNNNNNNRDNVGSTPSNTTTNTLKVSDMQGPHTSIVDSNTLRVTYPAGLYASKDGLNKHLPIAPATKATLSYSVFFEPGWCWGGTSKGGKLPGLLFNTDPAMPGGTGGNWIPAGGSFRVMWYGDGMPRAYIYYAKDSGRSPKDMSDQDPEYAKIAKDSGGTGHNLWVRGFPTFKIGEWNSLVVHMELNTPGKRNGVIALTVNGTIQKYTKMMWRTSANQLIRDVAVATFHGGGSPAWACATTTYAKFKDFKLTSS